MRDYTTGGGLVSTANKEKNKKKSKKTNKENAVVNLKTDGTAMECGSLFVNVDLRGVAATLFEVAGHPYFPPHTPLLCF